MRLLAAYNLLPPTTRSIAATIRGYYLRSWRFGPETEQLVAEALERDRWTPERVRAWQEERLAYMLHRAATQVPYYRQYWQQRRAAGDNRSYERLENWPLLEKEPLRRDPSLFVADGSRVDRLFHAHTSGTSGKPLHIYQSRTMLRAWYALFETRWRRWNGLTRWDRWAVLGGQLVTPVEQRTPPFWVWNAASNQLYMSSYHLAPDLVPHYIDEMIRRKVVYLWAYTSAAYALSQEVLRTGCKDLRLKVVITNAEPLYRHQREVIEKAFGCRTLETYGMEEMVAGAAECEHGRLHLWPELGALEVMENGQHVAPGGTGDLICTGLLNEDMPLIRYRILDRGALPAKFTLCTCGRGLPMIDRIEGRTDDVLYTPDGRRIGRLDPVFKSDLPVREVQIVQEAIDRVRIRYVAADGFTADTMASISGRLQERMGPVKVVFESLAQLERGANGKLRAVVCKLSGAEIESALSGKMLP